LWAISEMTKLPKFITEMANEQDVERSPAAQAQRQAAQAQRQAAQSRLQLPADQAPFAADPGDLEAAQPAEQQEFAHGEEEAQPETEQTAEPTPVPPTERPSKRRQHANADPQTGESQPNEAAEKKEGPASEAPPRKDRSAEPKTDVKVASGSEPAAPSISRAKAVRMRRKDGSSVIVYYPANHAPKAATAPAPEGSAESKAAGDSAATQKPARRVVHTAGGESKARENPLR
jgi:hypothetical protein